MTRSPRLIGIEFGDRFDPEEGVAFAVGVQLCDLRCDPAPCWNRAGDLIAVPAIADDKERTRQTFLMHIKKV